MSKLKLRKLLNELDHVDAQLSSVEATRQLALQNAALRRRIGDHLRDEQPVEVRADSAPTTSILEDAIALEARLANHYPAAESLMRELVNTLSRLGI